MALSRPARTAAGAPPAPVPLPATPSATSAGPMIGAPATPAANPATGAMMPSLTAMQQAMGSNFRPPTQPVTLGKLTLNADRLNSPILAAVLRDFYRERVELVGPTQAEWIIKAVDLPTIPEHDVTTTRIEMAETNVLGVYRSRRPVAIQVVTTVPAVTPRRVVFEQRATGNQLAVCDPGAPDVVVRQEFREAIDAMLSHRALEIQEEGWERFEAYMRQHMLGQPAATP